MVEFDDIDTHDDSSTFSSLPTVSVVRLSPLNTCSEDLALVMVNTFLVFIMTYPFFCLVISLMGLRVIAKFGFELD